jgi:hypothetical protein
MRSSAGASTVAGQSLRYVMALAIGVTVCAAISFGVVRYLTRGVSLYQATDPAAMAEAIALRSHANDLAGLAAEYFAAAATGPPEAPERRVAPSFRPRLNDLRQRLTASTLEGAAPSALLRATDALSASAATPRDEARRHAAARAVLEALSEAERRVGSLNVNPQRLPPPVPMVPEAPE